MSWKEKGGEKEKDDVSEGKEIREGRSEVPIYEV